MNKFLLLIQITLVLPSISSADTLDFTLDLKADAKSYDLKLENQDRKSHNCSIEIVADVGDSSCTKKFDSYRFKHEKITIAAQSVFHNPNFGIDYLHNLNRKNPEVLLVYCGKPDLKYNCN